MEFTAHAFNPATVTTDCLVLLVAGKGELTPAITTIDQSLDGFISRMRDREMSDGQGLLLQQEPAGLKARRLLLAGTGNKALTDRGAIRLFNDIANCLAKARVKTAAICLDGLDVVDRDRNWCACQVASIFGQVRYRPDQCKSKPDKPVALTRVSIRSDGRKESPGLNEALRRGAAIAEGVNLARELGDLPANRCNPTDLADRARALAASHQSLTTRVLTEKQMLDLGMGSLLSVTAGADTPARLIVIQYRGTDKVSKPIALVGKGVTFDTGGISLKPGAAMDEMKYDMCGAASVLGTLLVAALLELPLNLVAVIPAVENMPSGKATRPGDIVTSMSGQTIEILNTDAEGRLILCDALTYVARFKPVKVIDIATLTGACVIALGNHAHGLYSNNEELAAQLLASGERSGDRAWRLPLWEEYDKQLKSNFADMANIGGRNAGSVTAACFLHRFARDYNWAHLDIAGTAWKSGSDKGATGRPVPLLVDFLLHQC